jgi:hypothetical protein
MHRIQVELLPATTELMYGSMIGFTMAEKRLLRGSEGKDTYPSLSAPFSANRGEPTEERNRSQNLVRASTYRNAAPSVSLSRNWWWKLLSGNELKVE